MNPGKPLLTIPTATLAHSALLLHRQAAGVYEVAVEAAKAAVRRAFDRLLAWADGERGGDVHWHVAVHRIEV